MPKTLCVAGASGLVGSNIVKEALARGYAVHGTLRDHTAVERTQYLQALPGGAARLRLFSANMTQRGAFDDPVAGAD